MKKLLELIGDFFIHIDVKVRVIDNPKETSNGKWTYHVEYISAERVIMNVLKYDISAKHFTKTFGDICTFEQHKIKCKEMVRRRDSA